MNYKNILRTVFFIFISVILLSSCDKFAETTESPNAPYVLSLGITANGATTYYVVTTNDLMSEDINAYGKGLEQNGYRDYKDANKTIFSIGGLGVNNVTAITRNAFGYLQEGGSFVFDSKLSAFSQADNSNIIGLEIPTKAADGDQMKFYIVDINSASITKTINQSIAPISQVEWPSITGMEVVNNKVYLSYVQMNPTTFATDYVDTCYIAVYSYPDMTLEKVMKDTRIGAAGSWSAYNGIIKTETEDLYIMSNLSMANGFSKGGKNAGFLKIKGGTTDFDSNYFFDFESETGGLKPAHIQYIGNGLVFAEVSTLNPQTVADRWSDKNLKCSIIDLYNKTITDIIDIPVHNGNGGRRFTALVDGGFVYYPVSTDKGTFIYKVDPTTAKAEKGAQVSASFVAGFFKLN